MLVQRIAAFSDGQVGGNPAGVVVDTHLPSAAEMQRIAAEVGYSETAFAAKEKDHWRVRYFSPESEVPFCGHATIALGAVLAQKEGDGAFDLQLNDAKISVTGEQADGLLRVALQSPSTHSEACAPEVLEKALALFSFKPSDLNPDLPPALIHAGADHLILGLKTRDQLAAMQYDLDEGRQFMLRHGLVTILLVFAESAQKFHTRNPFASGGVYEDPATGAATAALAGYLRDLQWPHLGQIDIVQGEDMGMRSLLRAELTDEAGSSIRVSGSARRIDAD